MNEVKLTDWVPVYELLESLTEGDLIEIRRPLYTHWCVFIHQAQDDGIFYVVHLSSPVSGDKNVLSLFSSSRSLTTGDDDPLVQYCDLMLVAGMSLCRVNNSQDKDCRPFESQEIVTRALNECEKRKKYSIIMNNCEHFVTWCRYGTRISSQSSMAKSLAVGTAAAVVSGSGLAGVAACTACFIVCKKASKTWNKLARNRWSPY